MRWYLLVFLALSVSVSHAQLTNQKNQSKDSLVQKQSNLNFSPATYKGGYSKFKRFVKKNMVKPADSIPINRFGNSVRISFEVTKEGKPEKFKVVDSIGPKFDQEALRIAQLMPDWQPATENGVPVASQNYIYIYFKGTSAIYRQQAALYFEEGIYAYEIGNNAEAMRYFNLAIRYEPENLQYYLTRSALMLEMEQFEGACRDLNIIKNGHPEALALFEEFCQK